ncbi:lipase [Acanthamoeba castellanii str. Neff]|uniref:Lipase n=1 Tax=Acanthamoeba castellanii (strain ATCC 30010 / Neff) TaxID=1257118 RepID=L8GWA5_ACACF|nr:lipase [Acanthamoeba castellanii str. Neff]ELR17499.1 lipase [Acanthamoeba castellanii str. Neff]
MTSYTTPSLNVSDFFSFDEENHDITTTSSTIAEEDDFCLLAEQHEHEAEEEDIAFFSKEEALVMADYSTLAYFPLADNCKADPSFTVSRFETDLSTAYVRAQGSRVVITYKGTDTATDFATDFTPWPAACPELLPEGGRVRATIETHAASQGLSIAELDVTVTGHSLGAAQATLAALQMAQLVAAVDQIRLVTFGSPRVFTHAGAAFFNKLGLGARTLRVAENDVDPVTMVNLGSLGFKHVGLNLRVEKPAAAWHHLMDGYTGGLLAAAFIPTYAVGSRRAFLYTCRRILRLI